MQRRDLKEKGKQTTKTVSVGTHFHKIVFSHFLCASFCNIKYYRYFLLFLVKGQSLETLFSFVDMSFYSENHLIYKSNYLLPKQYFCCQNTIFRQI